MTLAHKKKEKKSRDSVVGMSTSLQIVFRSWSMSVYGSLFISRIRTLGKMQAG